MARLRWQYGQFVSPAALGVSADAARVWFVLQNGRVALACYRDEETFPLVVDADRLVATTPGQKNGKPLVMPAWTQR